MCKHRHLPLRRPVHDLLKNPELSKKDTFLEHPPSKTLRPLRRGTNGILALPRETVMDLSFGEGTCIVCMIESGNLFRACNGAPSWLGTLTARFN